MKDYQERVIEEKEDLDAKLTRLIAFFETPIFAATVADEQKRLRRQGYLMELYSDVLAERIAGFA